MHLLALILLAAPPLADPVQAPAIAVEEATDAAPSAPAFEIPPPIPPADRASDETPLSSEELADLRGGDAIIVTMQTLQKLTAINSGNSVNGQTVGSGLVNIGSGAFAGYEGIGNFVINTGHNNNLLGAVSVTVVMTPQP